MTLEKNQKNLQIVVLAAGQGTRMKSELPKPLVTALGTPILGHVLDCLENLSDQLDINTNIGVVVGHQGELIKDYLSTRENYRGNKHTYQLAWQKEQLGTAHALQSFFKDNPSGWESDYMAVVCGDTPLLESQDLKLMMDELLESNQNAICASFEPSSAFGFGRIQRGESGFKIIEQKDANEAQRKISEVNSGLYFFKTEYVKKYLEQIKSENKANEFYLTDLFDYHRDVTALKFSNPDSFLGVNDLSQLSYVEEKLLSKKLETLMKKGVRVIKPSTVYIEWSVDVEERTTIYPSVNLIGNTKIHSGCVIESGTVIKNSTIEDGTKVLANSYFEDALIGKNCQVGPFARIRPGSQLQDEVKVGNFVETKKSILKKGSKVSHLSYVGDAEIGANANIGCGFITCNYDGANKHKTKIGDNTFVGSDCQMIAPVEIGSNSFIAAGSTITHDVEDGGFAVARSRQVTKAGMAKKFLKTKE